MANTEVGSAYVSIFPNMKGFGGKVAQGVKGAFGSLATAAAAGGAAVAGAVTAIGAASLRSYADFEQLKGGVETLFKDSASTVMQYANEAYKTAGLSANQYMEQVTSFSASLTQSLGGDTAKAAEYGQKAIVDMADNANKMGSSMQSIQDAYNGFAKSNYTMLDNLKLGYGGTKGEMERLIADANRVKAANGEMANLSINSFADIVEAIHTIQTEMGITGTTAEEAATTIQGSIGMMNGAWENWLTGLADDNADMGALTDNLLFAIDKVVQNVAPRVAIIASRIIESLPGVVAQAAPAISNSILTAMTNAWNTVSTALGQYGIKLPKLEDGELKQKLEELKQKFIEFGELAKGKIANLATGFQPLISVLGTIAPIAIGAFAGFKVFGTVGTMLTSAQTALTTFGTAFTKLGTMITQSGGALNLLKIAFTTLASPIGIVAGVIAALAAGFVYLYTTNEQFRNGINSLLQIIGGALIAAFQTIQQALAPLGEAVMSLLNQVQPMMQALMPIFQAIASVITGVLVGAIGILAGVISGIIGAVQGFIGVLNGVMQVITGVANIIVGVFTGNLTLASTGVQQLGSGIVAIFSGLLGMVTGFLGGFVSGVIGFFQNLLGLAQGKWEEIKTAVVNKVMEMANGAIQNASNLVNGVIQFFAQLPGKAQEKFNNMLQTVASVLSSLLSSAKSKASEILNGIISKFAEAPGKAREKFNEVTRTITSTLSGFVSQAMNLGRNIIDGIVRGVSNGVGALVDAVRGAAQRALNAAKSLLGIKSPSREFAWIGSMVMEGWEQPITKGADSMAGAVGNVVDKMIGAADKGVTVSGLISAVGSEEVGASQVVSGVIQLFIDTINNYDTETDLIPAINRALARAEVTGA